MRTKFREKLEQRLSVLRRVKYHVTGSYKDAVIQYIEGLGITLYKQCIRISDSLYLGHRSIYSTLNSGL